MGLADLPNLAFLLLSLAQYPHDLFFGKTPLLHHGPPFDSDREILTYQTVQFLGAKPDHQIEALRLVGDFAERAGARSAAGGAP